MCDGAMTEHNCKNSSSAMKQTTLEVYMEGSVKSDVSGSRETD